MGTVRRSRKGRVAALLRLVPDHSGHRNPRRAGQAQRPRGEDRPGRRRNRGHLHRHRRSLRRQLRRDDHLGPRPVAQERGAGTGRDDRVAAGGGRRTARRPLDGTSDQDRAERSGAGALRPQRRVPRDRRGGIVAQRLLPLRIRGRAPGHGAYDPRDPADRRVHRQRLGAVAHPCDEGLPCHHPADRGRGPRRRFHALRAQRKPGPRLGIPRQDGTGTSCRRP